MTEGKYIWISEAVKEHLESTVSTLQFHMMARLELNERQLETRLGLVTQGTDQRFLDYQRSIDIASTAAQRATDLAGDTQKDINATQNEFRGQLKDQAGTFMPRAEADGRWLNTRIESDQRQKTSDDQMSSLRKSVDELRKLVYIGLGLVLAIQFLYPLLRTASH